MMTREQIERIAEKCGVQVPIQNREGVDLLLILLEVSTNL